MKLFEEQACDFNAAPRLWRNGRCRADNGPIDAASRVLHDDEEEEEDGGRSGSELDGVAPSEEPFPNI